jgi:hypothetical protein
VIKITNSLKQILKDEKSRSLILTPKVTAWYLDHPSEGLYTPEAMERVWKELTKPGRERSGSFSASSAGQCLRRQELAFLGKPQKGHLPNLREVFETGTWTHARVQALMLSAGLIEDIEVALPWPKFVSMGSADGKGFVHWDTPNKKWRQREFLLEIKTVGSFAWEKKATEGPSEDHLDQMHRYMLVSGIDLCVYWLVDKGNVSGLGNKEFVIEADQERLDRSQRELEELKKAYDTQTLHPILTPCKIGQGPLYRNCPFTGKDGPCRTAKGWE